MAVFKAKPCPLFYIDLVETFPQEESENDILVRAFSEFHILPQHYVAALKKSFPWSVLCLPTTASTPPTRLDTTRHFTLKLNTMNIRSNQKGDDSFKDFFRILSGARRQKLLEIAGRPPAEHGF